MKRTPVKKAAGFALGTAMIGVLSSAALAAPDASPFGMKTLSSGYMVADNLEGSCGGMKTKKGKHGEGKCGGMKTKEGKCGGMKGGEGKCGGSKMPSMLDCTYDEDLCG